MKNLIKKSLLIVAVITTIASTASEFEGNVNITKIEAKLIHFKVKNNYEDLTVRVKDIYGEVLYSEQFETQNFSKKFDLTTLPNGDYFIEVKGNTAIEIMSFTVNSKEVKLNYTSNTRYL